MADQPITGLPTKTASGVASTDKMLGIDSAEGYQILVRDVAKYIIENCDVSTLAGAVRTPKAAIDLLNSKTTHTNWGTTLSATTPGTIHGMLLIANYYCVQVWMPASTDINIFVMTQAGNYAKAGNNSLSFGYTRESTDYLLERTANKSFTITSPEANTLTWISY